MAQFFGFTVQRSDKLDNAELQSVVPPNEDEAPVSVSQYGGVFGQYLDIDVDIQNENKLIDKYREISILPEVNQAIEQITTEAIVVSDSEPSVSINLDNIEDVISDNVKEKIRQEFKTILKLLRFNTKGHDIFKLWYVDGRIHYHTIIDNDNLRDGIVELRFIDPRKIKRVREIRTDPNDKTSSGMQGGSSPYYDSLITNKNIREFYIYNPNGISGNNPINHVQSGSRSTHAIRMTADSIAHANSGEVDHRQNHIVSFLHKAIRPSNNLKMLEDATIVYALARAPERRVFYVDTGSLPNEPAERYVNQIKNQYKNKIAYDANTGEVKDNPRHMAITEDYWLPRREGSRGTEIDTLQGGQQLGQMGHVEYFRDKLYQSLYVPKSRFEQQPSMFGGGTDITRDEVFFSRFIDRLRRRFSMLFQDLLGKQVVLKNIMSIDEWDDIKDDIIFTYLENNHFSEMLEAEIMQTRFNLLRDANDAVGTYFSAEYVSKNILHMTEDEIKEERKLIKEEKGAGLIEDPLADPVMGGGFGNQPQDQQDGQKPAQQQPAPVQDQQDTGDDEEEPTDAKKSTFDKSQGRAPKKKNDKSSE